MVFPPEAPTDFLRRFEAAGPFEAPELEPPKMAVGSRDGSLVVRPRPLSPEERDKRAGDLQKLAIQVSRTLHYFADTPLPSRFQPDVVYGLCVESLEAGSAGVENRGGIFVSRMVNPLKGLLDALEGAEAGRVRRCPICNRIFFALRSTREACSRRCNANRRVGVWRNGEDRRTRQAWKLKQQGKDVREIARILNIGAGDGSGPKRRVTQRKVGLYIARARKQHKMSL